MILNFDEKSVSEIKKNNFDLIYFSGSGIIRGEILNSTKIGVISLHHADNRFMRGKHSGFWEVLKNKPTTGFIIQKLNIGGLVLALGPKIAHLGPRPLQEVILEPFFEDFYDFFLEK